MGHGESYEDNARRELEEEMGVKAAPKAEGGGGGGRAEGELRHCFSFHYKDDHTNVWGDAWDCVWGGEIVPQPVSGYVCCVCFGVFRVSVVNYCGIYHRTRVKEYQASKHACDRLS